MAEEFTIKSNALEAKINQLLPSQGGFATGLDLSASSMIIPVVDLTESAEGSNVRQDLQTAIAYGSATTFDINNTTTTIANTPGFWRLYGVATVINNTSLSKRCGIIINDGSSDKDVWNMKFTNNSVTGVSSQAIDNTFFLRAGDTLKISCNDTAICAGSVRQIADINGNLINPSGFTIL